MKRFAGWGGRRKNSGRKKIRKGMLNHTARPVIRRLTPCHVNLHLHHSLKSLNLRTKGLFKLFSLAVKKARLKGLSIVHYAIMDNHLHLIVEAKSNEEVSKGMQSFALSMNKLIKNRVSSKIQKLWKDRYFLRKLTSPNEVRIALEYVLRNPERKFKRQTSFDLFTSVLSLMPDIFGIPQNILDRYQVLQRDLLCGPKSYLLIQETSRVF